MKNKIIIPVLFIGIGLMVALLLGSLQRGVQTLYAAPTAATWYVSAATGNDGNSCLAAGSACLTIQGAVDKAADDDTIQVAAGIYDETLDISKAITVTGAGPEVTFLDGGGSHRVLQTAGSGTVRLENLTIQNGFVTGSGQRGGGIFNFGTLFLVGVTVQDNEAGGDGGAGILNSGHLTLENSQVISNTTSGGGGGIYGWGTSTTTITHSLIQGNVGINGGGLFIFGDLAISDTTIRNNNAPNGGAGLYLFGSIGLIERTTFSGNHTTSDGAGIYNNYGNLTLTNATFSGNSANNYTALVNVGPTAAVTVTNSTIANNTATSAGTQYGGIVDVSGGFVTLGHNIFYNNAQRNCLVHGTWTSIGYNLSSDFRCDLTNTGDLQGVDPLLGSLANNGGETETHALLATSPAIDAGNNATCPATDQRGVARPFDGDSSGSATCDIGAFEARLQLTISDASVLEGDTGTTDMVFTVSLAPVGSSPVSVDYETVNDTAVSPTDYNATSGNLIFAPGQISKLITVTVNGNTIDEVDKTFSVQLSNASGADSIDGSGIGTIIDDDGLPSLTIDDVTIVEGSSGTKLATFTVTLSPIDTQPVTVNYATVAGTAVANQDFTTTSGLLTFAPGDSSKTIAVPIIGDLIDEGTSETFSVNLTSPSNAAITDGSGTGTITDDDTAQLSLVNSPSALEGNSGSQQLIFTVTLSRQTAFPVTVDYQTNSYCCAAQYATPGEDYVTASGTLSFAAGETSKTIAITIYGDLLPEEDETFGMMISNGNPVSIVANAASGTILSDDQFAIYLPVVIKP